jgi:hypothetical protein
VDQLSAPAIEKGVVTPVKKLRLIASAGLSPKIANAKRTKPVKMLGNLKNSFEIVHYASDKIAKVASKVVNPLTPGSRNVGDAKTCGVADHGRYPLDHLTLEI